MSGRASGVGPSPHRGGAFSVGGEASDFTPDDVSPVPKGRRHGILPFLPPGHPLRRLEEDQRAAGFRFVAGVDEAGRGPLAGPVVVAAVILPPDVAVPPVADSKALSAKARCELRNALLALPGLRHAVVEIDAVEIDRLNILRATHEGMRRALLALLPDVDVALVDGLRVPNLPVPAEFLVKGDARCAAIAAASILAKERRDEIMAEVAKQYPEYGFERHKGYGTADHLAALRAHGPCPLHRRSFAPVRNALGLSPSASLPEDELSLFP